MARPLAFAPAEQLAKRPELLDDFVEQTPRRPGCYARRYRISGASGQCLLQRVAVRIRFAHGEHCVAKYRQTYYEFFQFDRSDDTAIDVHDFDYMRDGWRQAVIAQLFRQHGLSAQALQSVPGERVLTVQKSFYLAPGEVVNTQPHVVAGGARFGLLAHGPDGPSRVAMQLCRPDTAKLPSANCIEIAGLPKSPAGFAIAGEGQFTCGRAGQTGGQTGWQTTECLQLHFATLTDSTSGAASYRATPARFCRSRTATIKQP